MYHKGQLVKVTQGLFKGREAFVLSHKTRGDKTIYELKIERFPTSFHVRGSYIRAVSSKSMLGKK